MPLGAALGLIAMSLHRATVYGVAAVLLLWASGGLVLDGFRLFFLTTGIPAGDFAIVDGRGAVSRLCGALGLVAVAIAYIRNGRTAAQVRRPLVIAGLVLGAIYPLAKFYWSAGGTLLMPEHYTEGFPAAETVMLIGASTLVLLLAKDGGRHRLIRIGLITTGTVVTLVLLNQGLLPLFGLLNHAMGAPRFAAMDVSTDAWIVDFSLYTVWALLGLVIGRLVLGYRDRVRVRVAR
ncbi:hypothetical protein F0L68_33135 [Solihabitans fulvus]|uniref:Uncharacterized protein n=1 Tax=Solihabitans fulvus TaxID=1892852 RepID=A0A5B2WSJ9_9PSEU|nr:hypothetical protein [Solihabitans fulvus]KAA2253359.1 hypothetical protein F0L68_33135 [Solihabitans fulvus]